MTRLGHVVSFVAFLVVGACLHQGYKFWTEWRRDVSVVSPKNDQMASLKLADPKDAQGAHFTLLYADGSMNFFGCSGELLMTMAANGTQTFKAPPKQKAQVSSKLERAMISIARQDPKLCDSPVSLLPPSVP